jgi:Ser/Thr protein kinase RdoA (MazF antagonist)
MNHDLKSISRLFDMRADFVHAHPYGSGHINDTYCAWYDAAGQRIRYIHQRINHNVFKNPIHLMENVDRVTRHSLQLLLEQGHPEAYRRTLTCIPATDGKPYAIDTDGNVWRTYPFIERARGYDVLETTQQAYQAARAFGEFQKLAAGLPGGRLHETIPHFHHTRNRYEAFLVALEKDSHQRAAEVAAEIDFVRAHESDCSRIVDLIASGEIPERVTHNDTKLNNVLLDDVTAEGVCVIDLDTTMPGSALYDFGDMVRTAVPKLAEDATDLAAMDLKMDMFEALLGGYTQTATFLNEAEKNHLAYAGKLLTLECGIRFLTDYLQGDVYFKIKRPSQNIDRCRNQFAFVQALERRMPELEDLVARKLASSPL